MNKSWISVLVLFIALSSFSACKIFKVAKKPITKKTIDTTAAKAKVDTAINAEASINTAKKQLIANLQPLWNRHINFTTFTGKAKMHYEGAGQKLEFTIHLRVKKDSVIWGIVTAVGGLVQVGRVYITPDSFKMVNYINRTATVMPLSHASKLLPAPVDFSILQNFIIGNALMTKGTITDATDFGGALSIEVTSGNYLQLIAYNKSDSTIRTAQMRTTNSNGPQGMTQMGGYNIIDGRKFSTNRTVNIQNAGQVYSLDMNFTSADFDQQQDYPFSIPKTYELSGD